MRTRLFYFSLISFFFIGQHAQGIEVCSRKAVINHQEVLVDPSSYNKGEGLSFYLDQDPQAKMYMDQYRDNKRPFWLGASIGTLGTGLMLTGLFTRDDKSSGIGRKEYFLIGGAAVLALNFLISRTLDFHNEKNLSKAIDVYNQRNVPKIYFSPFQNTDDSGKSSMGIQGGVRSEF